MVVEPSPRTMVHLNEYKARTRPPPSSSRLCRRCVLYSVELARISSPCLAARTENRAFANYVRVGSFRRYRSRLKRTEDPAIFELAASRLNNTHRQIRRDQSARVGARSPQFPAFISTAGCIVTHIFTPVSFPL